MQRVRLGSSGPLVSRIGLGCMGMSDMYGPGDRGESLATIAAALDAGVTLLDTGDFYGMGHNEQLLGEALHGVRRDQVCVSVKFGAQRDPAGNWLGFDTRPSAVKTACAYSLRRLGLDHIDIYRPSRLDPQVPIEETIGAIADLVRAGYVRHIGLSEVGADTVRRAAAVHPIVDLQIEYGLATRSIEAEILPTCRALGTGITAYGVLARGLISGNWRAPAPDARDMRRFIPRFAAENLTANLALVDQLRPVAEVRGLTVAQAAIAWVLAQGEDIVPLVGARRLDRLSEALGALNRGLSAEDVAAIGAALPAEAVAGTRYAAAQMATLDSEKRR